MKRFIVFIAIILIISSVTAEETPGTQPRAITGLSREYALWPAQNYRIMLGISPDGKTLAIYESGTGPAREGTIVFLDSTTMSEKGRVAIPDQYHSTHQKKAVWSPDGRYMLFRKTGRFAVELIQFRGSCIFVVDTLTMSIVQISDDGYKPAPGKTVFDTPLYYDPMFSPDGKSVVYHRLTAQGIEIVQVNMTDKSTRVIFREPDRANTVDAVLLSDRHLLVMRDNHQIEKPRTLSLFDIATGTEKPVMSTASSRDAMRILEIRSVSSDGRNVLVHVWANNPQPAGAPLVIDTIAQIRFGVDFKTWDIRNLGVAKNEYAINSAQTIDGRYVLYGSLSVSSPRTVRYYIADPFAAGVAHKTLAEITWSDRDENAPGAYANPLNAFTDGLVLTRDQFMIRYNEGFRIYNLE